MFTLMVLSGLAQTRINGCCGRATQPLPLLLLLLPLLLLPPLLLLLVWMTGMCPQVRESRPSPASSPGLSKFVVTLLSLWPRRQSGIADLKALQDLSIETQRISFYTALSPTDAGPPLAKLRLVAQELAMYGGASPVTEGVID